MEASHWEGSGTEMLRKQFRREVSQQGMVQLTGTVLVVDTDPLDLDTYSNILRSLGHEVVPCASYQEAIRQLMTEKFELVVVDQGGANFEGRVVLERLCALGTRVPTIVLGRQKNMRCYVEALELGADDYFEKPVPQTEIKRVVTALVPPRVFTGAFQG
jgi:DNA-binding response OmpR family regulator